MSFVDMDPPKAVMLVEIDAVAEVKPMATPECRWLSPNITFKCFTLLSNRKRTTCFIEY